MSSISDRLRGVGGSELGRTLATSLLVVGLAGALDALQVWEALDAFIFDGFTVALAAEEKVPIVIVGIDDPSFSELGQRWPWPRDLHARLVERLSAAGAAVVAFDVVFSEPSEVRADATLARAIRDSGHVVLAGDMVLQDTSRFRGVQRVEPMPLLREAGAAVGIASVEVDRDQVVRRFPRDPDAFWRVALDRYLAARGRPAYPATAPGPGALLRYAHASAVEYVSYYQAVEPGLLPPEVFRDKLVLVGLVLKAGPELAQRHTDTYATPFLRFSRIYAHGVEVQSQFVAGALAGRTLRPVGKGWSVGLALAVLLVGVRLLRRWRAGPATLYIGVVAATLVASSLLLFATANLWLPVALPVGVAAGLYVGRGATAYVDEARRRVEIRRAFEHYVAPAVVAEMTAHPERLVLGGQRRELTVMFTDLAGFTSMSEGLAPEAVARILTEHLSQMSTIVLKHGGTIDKFIGDALMAIWGAPLDDPRHAQHAVDAAVEMQQQMERTRSAERAVAPTLHMRIGLNTGTAVVGNLGSKARFDYTAIGDAVNLASRLESANRLYGSGILLTAAVAQRLDRSILLRYVDRIRVKGKREAIDVFTPCGTEGIALASEAARSAHAGGDAAAARAAWTKVLEVDAQDPIARLQLARLHALEARGAAQSWDGAFDLETK